jgi:hypothetical protein
LADVFVKHATPPPGLTIEQAAADTWERGGADALIVSGSGTGSPPDLETLGRLRKAMPGTVLLVGSGTTTDNVSDLAELADGAIVGSSLKKDGGVHQPVDAGRAQALVAAARRAGWI